MTTRREFLHGSAKVALAAGGTLAGSAALAHGNNTAFIATHDLTAQRYIELPLQPGDEIAAMTVFRDELIVVSKHGELFRLQPDMFS